MDKRTRTRARRRLVVIGLLFAFATSALVLPPRVAGATTVCGHLTGANVWPAAGNPYYMTCTVTVDAGASLEIQAGVVVLATPSLPMNSMLTVQGVFVVSGTGNLPVVFDSNASNPARGDWDGIDLGSASYVSITELVVRHAGVGLRTGGLSPTGQALAIRDSEFDSNYYGIFLGGFGTNYPTYLVGVGVRDNLIGIRGNASVDISGSTIDGNTDAGISVGLYGSFSLTNSRVTNNSGSGLSLRTTTSPPDPRAIVSCNAIAGNGFGAGGVGYGIDLAGPAGTRVATVLRNNLENNANQVRDAGASAWDNGTAGNFWSDYTGTDANGDGFGDTPYVIDADSQDNHPYVAPVPNCPGGRPTPVDEPPGAVLPLDAQFTGNQGRDVTLTWRLSGDDGAGENDVTSYLLYEGTTFESGGVGYGLLATLPAGTSSYIDPQSGMRDPQQHFYRLVTKDAAGHATASADQFVKYVRTLAAGEQLLSVPVRVSHTSVDSVLRGLDYALARTSVNPAGQGKNWIAHDKAKPWGDLTSVESTMALWLLVNAPSDL